MAHFLITGANRGLGFEFARQVLERGDRVTACCRRPDEAQALKALGESSPGRLRIVGLDVGESAAIVSLPGQVEEAVDVVILNAGIAAEKETLGTLEAAQMGEVMHVNAIAPMLLMQALAEAMPRASLCRFVCISSVLGSIAGARGLMYGLSYGMSKAALNMGVKKLSGELAERGIVAMSLHPGWVKTDMGGEQAHLMPQESIAAMLRVIDGLEKKDAGTFLDLYGKVLPW